eukprot:5557065-Pleurochrysis_carterae.AAC.2
MPFIKNVIAVQLLKVLKPNRAMPRCLSEDDVSAELKISSLTRITSSMASQRPASRPGSERQQAQQLKPQQGIKLKTLPLKQRQSTSCATLMLSARSFLLGVALIADEKTLWQFYFQISEPVEREAARQDYIAALRTPPSTDIPPARKRSMMVSRDPLPPAP